MLRNRFGILRLLDLFWYTLCASTIKSVVIKEQVLIDPHTTKKLSKQSNAVLQLEIITEWILEHNENTNLASNIS